MLDYVIGLIVVICSGLFTGPFTGALINLWGCRVVGVLGGFLSSVGIVMSLASRNVYYVCLTFGAITGMSTW